LDASLVTNGTLSLPIALTANAGLICLWHSKLAHLSLSGTKTLASMGLVPELHNAFSDPGLRLQCDACAIGKAKATPFIALCDCAVEKLQLVHSDLLTINVPSLRGMRYILTFVDDFSCKLWVYPLATKSETFNRFKASKAMVELESGCKLKALRVRRKPSLESDN
jgi:hypothetical protein